MTSALRTAEKLVEENRLLAAWLIIQLALDDCPQFTEALALQKKIRELCPNGFPPDSPEPNYFPAFRL